MLIFSPEQSENILRRSIVFLTESKSLRIRVISSANKHILISLQSILIPLMLLTFLILFAKVSRAVMKRYAERGHPCLTAL